MTLELASVNVTMNADGDETPIGCFLTANTVDGRRVEYRVEPARTPFVRAVAKIGRRTVWTGPGRMRSSQAARDAHDHAWRHLGRGSAAGQEG